MRRAWTVAIIFLFFWAAIAQANAAPGRPLTLESSGQATWPPATDGSILDTEIGKLASSMKRGTWAKLETKGLTPGFMYVTAPNGKVLHIAGWTDDGKWDPVTKQFLYLGFRQVQKFIVYSAETNEWREIPNPGDTGTGHIYSNNALDSAHGIYYHAKTYSDVVHKFSLANQVWDQLPAVGLQHRSHGTALEFFPGLGLFYHSRHEGIFRYDQQKHTWLNIATQDDKGKRLYRYVGIARYNPKHEEMLFAGGYDTGRNLIRLDKNGKLTTLAEIPGEISVRQDRVLVDPSTGDYLFWVNRALYKFSSVLNEFTPVPNYTEPFDSAALTVPATIPELGVIMFVDKEVWLYKP